MFLRYSFKWCSSEHEKILKSAIFSQRFTDIFIPSLLIPEDVFFRASLIWKATLRDNVNPVIKHGQGGCLTDSLSSFLFLLTLSKLSMAVPVERVHEDMNFMQGTFLD